MENAMNKHIFRKVLSLPVLSFLAMSLSSVAHAVIVDGTFKGTVISVGDNGDNNNPYFVDFFSSNVVGSDFSGSFWYDTDLAPVNTGTTGQWRFTEHTNWLGVTFNVDGKTLNASNIPDGFTQTNSLEIHNIADVNGYTGIHDFNPEYFGIREFINSANGDFTSDQSAGISFLDSIIPSLSGNSLIQDFTWHDEGAVYEDWDDIPALALYFNANTLPGNLINAGLAARLSEITVSPRTQVSVPEPSALILIVIGVAALITRRRKMLP
jgi:hypothetical protein